MRKIEGTIRLHLWIESEGGMILGIGRAQLIEYVGRYGSLQKAAKKMGISYRAAWGRIKKTEEVLGCKLLEKTTRGYQLTEEGKQLNELYLLWFKQVEEFALNKARNIFPWDSVAYQDDDLAVS